MEISKKMLLLNIVISQIIIIALAIVSKELFIKEIDYKLLLAVNFDYKVLLVLAASSSALLTVQLLFHKYVSKDRLLDEINVILLEQFSLPILLVVFLSGSFAEELLFRGIMQYKMGIIIASLLFALIHFRYIKKIFILLEVFVMGLILGIGYQLTSIIWVPVLSHFLVNFITALLIRKGYLKY